MRPPGDTSDTRLKNYHGQNRPCWLYSPTHPPCSIFRKVGKHSSTYELAISEPLPQEPLPLPHIAPHLTDYFYQTRNGKYSVSTIDRGIQTQIESLVERWNSEFKRSDIRNLAILVIDIRTNQAIAYCGNVHFDKEQSGNQVDVIRSPRSTGSILKPFLYYAMGSLHKILICNLKEPYRPRKPLHALLTYLR